MAGEAARTSLELMYHVSRELTGALNLRAVLQRVLYLAIENIGASNGSIIVLDENGQPADSAFRLLDREIDHATVQLRLTFERGLAGWVARNRQAALVPDTSQDERWLRLPDDAEDEAGPKSALGVPILARDLLVGVMTLVHPRPGTFREEHLALVQSIADQAGFAILNARLYAESQRQAQVMTAIAESAAVITATLKLDDVLQRILEQATNALRVEAATLALIDPQTRELEFRASTSKAGQSPVGMRVAVGKGVIGWVAREGRGLIIPDAYLDSRFNPEFDRRLGFRTRAIACAPIRSLGQVIGALEVINPLDGAFDQDALQVLTGIGSLAGTAIQHAQLFEQLEVAHQRYRELFEDSIDPILITDWFGNILEANRQAALTTGIESASLRRMNIAGLHSIDEGKLGPRFQKLGDGDTISYESALHVLRDQDIPIQVNVRRVQIDGVSHLQWILRDITERKNLDLLREDLITMIYHDLRSPLGNIVSSLDVVAAMYAPEEKPAIRSMINIAVRSTERIQRLTNSLLDINRLEAGQPVVNRQPLSPASLASDTVDAVATVAKNKEQQVRAEVSPDLPAVLVDADMIRRVLINLMENAIKFSPSGGKIFLGASDDGEMVKFWVEDSGPGIPPGEHERIFDKYTRLRSKEGPRGLGLGLAFCRLAVIGHGGRIWVNSEPGAGSTFCFTLPKAN